jgi:hypothetical protein
MLWGVKSNYRNEFMWKSDNIHKLTPMPKKIEFQQER